MKSHPYGLNVARNRTSVSVTLTASVPSTLIAIFGVDKLHVSAGGTAKPALPRLLAGRMVPPYLKIPSGRTVGDRVRSELERATRRSGATNVRLPSDQEIEEARRRMQRALSEMGHADLHKQIQGLPNAVELERRLRQIQCDLNRLRF